MPAGELALSGVSPVVLERLPEPSRQPRAVTSGDVVYGG
nr:hypothetical protein [Candidatus Protofrankia californiensis]